MRIPLKRKLMNYISYRWMDGWSIKSYSQEGEDMILRRIFEHKKEGFYIDVGAHHPMRFSNTYFFYKQGWSGINIDAMPGSMSLFSKYRSRDINIETPIGLNEEERDFYIFDEPALNGFDGQLSANREANTSYKVQKVLRMKPRMLKDVLAEYVHPSVTIDFLTIDVEGLDLEVLKSNDWQKYRPEVILIEILKSSLKDIDSNPTNEFICKLGYELYAKSVNTVIYKCSSNRP